MTRIFAFFILVQAYFNLSFGQTIKTKIYKEISKKESFIFKIETFDKSGNLLTETDCFNIDCTKKDVDAHIYNEKNQLIEDSIYTTKYGYHSLIWRKKYTYYENGLLKTTSKVNEKCIGGFDEFLTYFYNKNSKVQKIQTNHACDDNHYFNYPIHFYYDSIGNLISKVALYIDTSKIFYKNVYKYDNSRNLIEDQFYIIDRGDSLSHSSTKQYEYNKQNKKILYKWIYSLGNIDSTGYSYYENGLLKEEIPFSTSIYSKDFIYWSKYFYDTKGNLTKKQVYYLDKKKRVRKGIKDVIIFEYY